MSRTHHQPADHRTKAGQRAQQRAQQRGENRQAMQRGQYDTLPSYQPNRTTRGR